MLFLFHQLLHQRNQCHKLKWKKHSQNLLNLSLRRWDSIQYLSSIDRGSSMIFFWKLHESKNPLVFAQFWVPDLVDAHAIWIRMRVKKTWEKIFQLVDHLQKSMFLQWTLWFLKNYKPIPLSTNFVYPITFCSKKWVFLNRYNTGVHLQHSTNLFECSLRINRISGSSYNRAEQTKLNQITTIGHKQSISFKMINFLKTKL